VHQPEVVAAPLDRAPEDVAIESDHPLEVLHPARRIDVDDADHRARFRRARDARRSAAFLGPLPPYPQRRVMAH
jgi:hypothetical protein